MTTNNTVKTNSAKAWLLAARPKTLTGAAVPVLLGAMAAYLDANNEIRPLPIVLCFRDVVPLFFCGVYLDNNKALRQWPCKIRYA